MAWGAPLPPVREYAGGGAATAFALDYPTTSPNWGWAGGPPGNAGDALDSLALAGDLYFLNSPNYSQEFQVVNESGSDFSGWVQQAGGSWHSDGDAIIQPDVTASTRLAAFTFDSITALDADAWASCSIEPIDVHTPGCEIGIGFGPADFSAMPVGVALRFVTGGRPGTGAIAVTHYNTADATVRSSGGLDPSDPPYKLGFHRSGAMFTAFLNRFAFVTASIPVTENLGLLTLWTLNASAKFRGIGGWNRFPPTGFQS